MLEAAIILLEALDSFFDELPAAYQGVVERQKQKLLDPFHNRYAWIIRQQYGEDYIRLGLQLARERQKEALDELEERKQKERAKSRQRAEEKQDL